MALTYQEYIAKTGCQLVCDQLVSGFPHHKVLGSIRGGLFSLTDDGKELLAQIEGSVEVAAEEPAEPKTRRRRKAEVEEVETPAEE